MVYGNYYIKIISACLLLIMAISYAHAEEALTWEDCVEQALQNHPDLAAAREVLAQKKADYAVAWSDHLPQVTSTATGDRSRTAAGVENDTYRYTVSGEQLIFDGLKTPSGIAAAARDVKAAEYDYAVTSSDVRLNLRIAFVRLLHAAELRRITEAIAERRQQNLKMVTLRYDAGREHKGALLTARADLAEAKYEATEAVRNIELAQRRLIKELGARTFAPLHAIGDLAIEAADRAKPSFEALAQTTPFLQELIAQKESARFDVTAAYGDFFPAVYADGSYSKTNTEWPPEHESWSVGGRISFPLFEGGSRFAGLRKAKATLKEKEADEQSGYDTVVFTLSDTWTDFQNGTDKVEVERQFLLASEERAKIAQAQYSNGLISFDDWTIIEDALVQAKKEFLNSQRDALITEAYWVQAKGGTLEDVQE